MGDSNPPTLAFYTGHYKKYVNTWIKTVAPNGNHGFIRLCEHYDGTEMNIKYNWNMTEDMYKSKSTIQCLHYAIYKP